MKPVRNFLSCHGLVFQGIPQDEFDAWLLYELWPKREHWSGVRGAWEGPMPNDLLDDRIRIRWPLPHARWPYGPPDFHEDCCKLHRYNRWGSFCDCKASDASGTMWGAS